MGLVDDQMVVVRQGPIAHGHVREQQCMIDNDEVRGIALTPVAVEETAAALAGLAALGGAGAALVASRLHTAWSRPPARNNLARSPVVVWVSQTITRASTRSSSSLRSCRVRMASSRLGHS